MRFNVSTHDALVPSLWTGSVGRVSRNVFMLGDLLKIVLASLVVPAAWSFFDKPTSSSSAAR